IRSPEIDRSSASQWPGAAHEDKGFIGARVLHDLFRLDQCAADLRAVLRSARRAAPHGAATSMAPSAVATCRRDNRMLATHGGEFLGGVGVLHGGEQPPRCSIVPGLLPFAAPLADELAERLVE